MSLRLFTAPAGAGKTQFVLDHIADLCARHRLPRVLVIVPSGAQLVALRQRLGARFGVTLTDFHTLYHDVLDAAGQLPRLLPEAARYRVIRHIIATQAAALGHFAPIAEKPGFIAAVAQRIAELKEASVLPDDLANAADTPRTRDLATIYLAYQNFLRAHHLADREGMGWLARHALQAHPNLYADFDYIAADGFDQFNPTQHAILRLLAQRVDRLDITLTHQPHRLAHARFDHTLAQFSIAPAALQANVPPRIEPLDHLEKFLFAPNAPRIPHHDALHVITAPDRVREVREIARAVKHLLLAGADAARIAVVFRQLEPYHPIVRQVFTEFGIPFRVRASLALATNPLIAALLNLLRLSTNDFVWRDTLDALRAPYFDWRGLSDDDVMNIERITQRAIVVKGRAAWLAAFTPAPARVDEDDAATATESLEPLAVWRTQIDERFKKITPPERGTVRTFAAFIENLLGPDPRSEAWQRENFPSQFQADTTSLRVIERARTGDPEIAARDVAALTAFTAVVRGMIEADEIIGTDEIAWTDFLADLNEAVSAATYDLSPNAEQRVIIATVTQLRGVPHDFVFLGGLIESEFPARTPSDLLFTDTERALLAQRGVPLPDYARDEVTLFYEAVTLARQKLFLTYPYLDDDANPLYPSPYLGAVKNLFEPLPTTHIAVNALPLPQDAASARELAVSLAHYDAPEMERVWREKSPAWRHSLFARYIERQRESLAPFDAYSGVFQDERLRAEMAERFGARYVWSASQFNDWGACGFKFFARRLLKLAATTEPEEGLDVLQLGALYHAILEATYREFIARSMAVTPATLVQAQTILHERAAPILDDAPQRLGFRPTAWWAHERAEIMRRLDALLLAEATRNASHAPLPWAVEIEFGFGTPPVEIQLPHDTIRVRGKIDRLDRVSNGVVLIDYKSGSTPIDARLVIQGRHVQLPLYVLAAQALGYAVTNAFFVHIGNGETSGELANTARAEYLEIAQEHIARFVHQARQGIFPVQPTHFENGACTRTCEFVTLCRVGRWSVKKPLAQVTEQIEKK